MFTVAVLFFHFLFPISFPAAPVSIPAAMLGDAVTLAVVADVFLGGGALIVLGLIGAVLGGSVLTCCSCGLAPLACGLPALACGPLALPACGPLALPVLACLPSGSLLISMIGKASAVTCCALPANCVDFCSGFVPECVPGICMPLNAPIF